MVFFLELECGKSYLLPNSGLSGHPEMERHEPACWLR